MEILESSTILESHEQYLREKGTCDQSDAKSRLLSVLYNSDLSVECGTGNHARQVSKIIQEVRPASAGANQFTEYVALYVKHARRFPYLFRHVDDVSRVTRILETILLQNNSISDIEALVQCNSLSAVEDCLHTTFIAYIFLLDEDRFRVRVASCEILASIQTTNGKSFAKYLRCFLFWYLEEDAVNCKSKSLLSSYFRSAPDLLSATTYKDLIAIVTDVMEEWLSIKKSSITKAHCEFLIKNVLELIPLSASIEIISKSFTSSKVSRIRVSAIDFQTITIAKLYQIMRNSIPNSNDSLLEVDSVRIYEMQLQHSIVDERDTTAGRTEEEMTAELESMMNRSMAYVLDAVMLDPAEAVRYRALEIFQSLPREMIRKDAYRLLILKCRDLASKVRSLAHTIVADLGIEFANSILNIQELTMTTRHLLRITPLSPDLDSRRQREFVKKLTLTRMALQKSNMNIKRDGLGQPAKRSEADMHSDEKAARAKAVLATCHDLQLHLLPLDQMWDVIQNFIS